MTPAKVPRGDGPMVQAALRRRVVAGRPIRLREPGEARAAQLRPRRPDIMEAARRAALEAR